MRVTNQRSVSFLDLGGSPKTKSYYLTCFINLTVIFSAWYFVLYLQHYYILNIPLLPMLVLNETLALDDEVLQSSFSILQVPMHAMKWNGMGWKSAAEVISGPICYLDSQRIRGRSRLVVIGYSCRR